MQDGTAGKGTAEDHAFTDPGIREGDSRTLLVHPLSREHSWDSLRRLCAMLGTVCTPERASLQNACLLSGHMTRTPAGHVFATLRAAESVCNCGEGNSLQLSLSEVRGRILDRVELICVADFDPEGLGGYAEALHDRPSAVHGHFPCELTGLEHAGSCILMVLDRGPALECTILY